MRTRPTPLPRAAGLDIVVLCFIADEGAQLAVHLNMRDGTFGEAQHLYTSHDGDTRHFALGDLNGDGAVDVVIAAGQGNANLALLSVGGVGLHEQDHLTLPLGGQTKVTRSIAIGDLDGDGARAPAPSCPRARRPA